MQINDLAFSYGDQKIFDKFNLQDDSKLLILKGPSGCGKTTLLKLICDFLKPEKGHINPAYEKKCLIIQEDSLIPWITGKNNILKFLNITEELLDTHPMNKIIENFIAKIPA
jgi:ABC-type taurine transport system ATPase subunit